MSFNTKFLKTMLESCSNYELVELVQLTFEERGRRSIAQAKFLDEYQMSEYVVDLVREGRTIDAYKYLRNESNGKLSLIQAKDLIDALQEKLKPKPPRLPGDWRCPSCQTPTAMVSQTGLVTCANGHNSR